ncbi:glycosyltransferase family 25 protein [Aquamicrobium segne]|uniref:Glycosyltransferase family 25 protein n=1 Tax=Aquamicrobium segne TaxID=469547 RepID=A0ABW0GWJ5_9HYPH
MTSVRDREKLSIAVYVINLEDSKERLDLIRSQLDSLGIAFARVPAFDGRKLDLSKVEDYDADRSMRYMGRELVGGEIGCYRSHLSAAEHFLASDACYALVLEDDAHLLCNPLELLAKALPDLEMIDPDWLLMNIGNRKLKYSSSLSRYNVDARNYVLAAAHYFPMGTRAIVWSRKGARNFVAKHRTIFAPIDNYFRFWLTRQGHGYSFWPAPITATDAKSQIMASDEGERDKYGRKWYHSFAKKKRLLEEKIIALRHKYLSKLKLKSDNTKRAWSADPNE